MLKSVEETDGVMLDDGRELTVDLNGCDITFQANGPGTNHFFDVKHGSLRLTGLRVRWQKKKAESILVQCISGALKTRRMRHIPV